MPIYELYCPKCEEEFEEYARTHSDASDDDFLMCDCGTPREMLMSAPGGLKCVGEGFYKQGMSVRSKDHGKRNQLDRQSKTDDGSKKKDV